MGAERGRAHRLRKGHLELTLKGEKLSGRWDLVRTKGLNGARGEKAQKSWLLFKAHDEAAEKSQDEIVDRAPDSALTGRDLDQIAKGDSVAELPRAVTVELATLVDSPPAGNDWLHEIKLDGYRIVAELTSGDVKLVTRGGKDWTERMPTLAAALARLGGAPALLDGEVVVLDERGISDFQRLQNSLDAGSESELVYYAFDLLFERGEDLRALPLIERKARLKKLFAKNKHPDTIRYSEHVLGNGQAFFGQAEKMGLEGIISKRASSPYRAGRGHDWLKIKCGMRQEFTVVGYSDPGGSRSHLGALLLGVKRDGKLSYAGRVGTGFSEQSLLELHERLGRIPASAAPVVDPPHGADARGVHWVEPKLVAEIAFTGFTQDGRLRHPVFHGLRDDKPATEVKEERPRAAPKSAGAASSFPLTHPDKVMYPSLGITKRRLLEYYELVAERMLPHVANRPLTLVRCPEGQGKPCFFQKHPGAAKVKGLRSIPIREQESKAPYTVIDDAQGLFALVQLGVLEIHTWGSRADDFEHPDLLVFDLDPDTDLPFKAVIRCAQRLRELFAGAKLESFVKTTGGKGLHVCIPFQPEPELGWDEIKTFTEHVALALAQESPRDYVATQSKAKRKGKIFIDYLRNGRGATFIAPYSTRAREGAAVAAPLEWDELSERLSPSGFTVENMAARLKKLREDPFEAMIRVRQRLRPSAV